MDGRRIVMRWVETELDWTACGDPRRRRKKEGRQGSGIRFDSIRFDARAGCRVWCCYLLYYLSRFIERERKGKGKEGKEGKERNDETRKEDTRKEIHMCSNK